MNPTIVEVPAGTPPLAMQFTLTGIAPQVLPPNATTGQPYTCTFDAVPEGGYTLTIQGLNPDGTPNGAPVTGAVSVSPVIVPNVAADAVGPFTYSLV